MNPQAPKRKYRRVVKRKPEPEPQTRTVLTTHDFDQIADEILTEIAADYPEEIDLVMSFIKQAAHDPEAIKNVLKYKHKPVSPREFVEGKAYMDKKGVLWPSVMDALIEINNGSYIEAVLTGGIGVAKTTIALYSQAYQLYLISCLRDPHTEFGLDPSSEIEIVFQSLNESLAKGIDYERFRGMIESAPYFQAHFPFDNSVLSSMRFPNKVIVKPVSGMSTATIGANVIGGVIDEINYMAVTENSKMNRDGGTYDQAIANYNSIARRRESRFMQLGTLPGMLCLVSSRNYPGQFTDTKEVEARTNPRIYVYDKCLWELQPDRFCGEIFTVFTGDETRKPRLLREDETVAPQDEQLIKSIPIEYRPTFESDLLNALREIAGVSTHALHPFMVNTEAVAAAFGKTRSILSREDCDFVNSRVQIYPNFISHKQEPRHVHIDLAYAKDSAGIAVGHVFKFIEVNRGDHVETLPLIQLDCILEVQVPPGGEIDFSNIRRLLYALRDKAHLPIKWVSFDGFQSRDSMQILYQQGFSVGYQSMDTDTEAYDITKQAIYDGRLLAPEHAKAQHEMVTLEIDVKRKKIDHPPHSSKDVSDAIAGAVRGLTVRREIWARHGVSPHRIPVNLRQAAEPKSATRVQEYNDTEIELGHDWLQTA